MEELQWIGAYKRWNDGVLSGLMNKYYVDENGVWVPGKAATVEKRHGGYQHADGRY